MATSNDPPPAYSSIQDKINALGQNPSISDVKKLMSDLSNSSDFASLPAYEAPGKNTLTADQKTTYSLSVGSSTATSDTTQSIQQTCTNATNSIANINKMLDDLNATLAGIDALYTPPDGGFVAKLNPIQKGWQTAVQTSKTLAETMSHYAGKYINTVIPRLKDPNTTLATKQKMVTQVQGDVSGYQKQAQQMQTDFNTVKNNFDQLAGTFSTWAADQDKALEGQVTTAQGQLSDLQAQLAKKQQQFLGLACGAAAAIPITGVLFAMSGPLAPVVLIVGLAVCAGLTAGAIVVSTQIAALQDQIADKNVEISNLKGQIAAIDDARDKLTKTANTDMATMNDGVAAINKFWDYLLGDLTTIKLTLDDASENLSDSDWDDQWTTEFNSNIDTTQKIYAGMEVYLDQYARGISSP